MTYNGCISLVIPFEFIANKVFEKLLKLVKTEPPFIISEDGIELYCSDQRAYWYINL